MARIRDEIERDGPITFARFMDLALYDPDGGYYRSEAARPGRDGDFLTAPEAHPIFGAALSRAVADAWDRLGRPDPFVLREYGAGTGTLAVAILDGLATERPDLASAIRYEPIEVEPRRLEAIAARLECGRARRSPDGARVNGSPGRRVRPGQRGARRPADASGRRSGTASCARSSSASREGELRRRRGRPIDAGPGTPGSPTRASRSPTASGPRSAWRSMRWVAAAAAGLGRGVLLLIDYGYPAAELYDPIRRRDGTLRAYLRHRVHDDPYLHVGRQDLTAHVDVTAVERAASAAGLDASRHDHPGRVPRRARHRRTCCAAIQADPATTMEAYLAVRSALMRLLDPAAMGRFRVMAFGRGWPDGVAAGRAGLSAGASAHHRPHLTAPNRTGLGRCTYCCAVRRRGTIRDGRARPDGEWRANLHARSARAAPRHSVRAEPPGSVARSAPTDRMPIGQTRPFRVCLALHLDPRASGASPGRVARREFG